MSTTVPHSSTISAKAAPAFDALKSSRTALWIGLGGTLLAILGFLFAQSQSVDAAHRVAMGGLVAFIFWLSIALGMLLMVMLHHSFDAGWSTVIRRPLEHGLAALPWLGLFFIPLLLLSLFYADGGFIWKWMGTEQVADDILYTKKVGYLNTPFFIIRALLYFGIWIGLAWALRRGSFTQDKDGNPAWTTWNRKFSAAGLILVGLALTFAAIDWIKGLDFHWFSTMFGVWYFAGSMRAAFAVLTITCVLLVRFGPLQGLFSRQHLYEIGRMQLAFTVFWAYIAFSQYFLIYNADIPEETFWFVVREHGSWEIVGYSLVFCQFVIPFVYLLFYANKVRAANMIVISVWVLLFHLVEMYFYILPTKLTEDTWEPVYSFPIFDVALITDLAALIGIGGICAWAFLRSFPTQKVIPIRDPRILESVQQHG